MDYENSYIYIPASVLHDERLNNTEKLLYGLIEGLTKRNGYCYATNDYLAKVGHFEDRHLRRTLERLENFGLIKRDHDREGNRRIYVVRPIYDSTTGGEDISTADVLWHSTTGRVDIQTQGGGHLDPPYNNIYNNIDNISKDILSVEGETQLVDIEEVLERTAPEKPAKTKVNKKISHLERYANSLVLEKILERAKITTYPMALKQQRVFGNLIRKRIWDALPEQDRTPERVIVEIEKICDSFGKDQYHFKNMGDLRFYYYKMVLHSPLFAKSNKKEIYL